MGANYGCCQAAVDTQNFKEFCIVRASPEYQAFLLSALKSKILYNEDLFCGEWQNINLRIGKGIIYSPQKFYYEGDIIESKAEGIGKIIWPNRAIYTGSIINNQANGQGQLSFEDGDLILKGLWEKGEPLKNTKMIMIRKEQKSQLTIIDTKNSQKGQTETSNQAFIVKIEFGQGVIYEGQVKQKRDCIFKFQGKGSLTFADGSMYQGSFLNGKMDGFGKYYWAHNKHWYEGQYKNNFRDGFGTYYYSQSIFKSGVWKGGNLISQQSK